MAGLEIVCSDLDVNATVDHNKEEISANSGPIGRNGKGFIILYSIPCLTSWKNKNNSNDILLLQLYPITAALRTTATH